MLKSLPRSPFLLSALSAASLLAIAQTNASAAVTVTIQTNEPTLYEGSSANITITRTSNSTDENVIAADYASALSVPLTINGTAVNGTDYTTINTPVTIPAGASSVEVTFASQRDNVIESSVGETARFAINPSSAYTVGSPGVIVQTILESRNLPVVSITQSQNIVDEDGAVTTPVVLTVRRAGNTNTAITVPLVISGTAINGVDYETIPSSVDLAAGVTEAQISITTIDDTIIEGSEVLRVGVQPSTTYTISEFSPRASLEIRDNDIRPVISVIRGGSDILEGGGTTFVGNSLTQTTPGIRFVVRRTGSTQNQLRVNVATSGTATEGADYFPINSSVIIPQGEESVVLEIATFTDAIVEGAESVILSALPNVSEYDLAPSSLSASVNILDDDQAPALNIVASDASGAEPNDVLVFQVSRPGGANDDNSQPLTFRYSVSGTASRSEYSALSGTGVIPSGSSITTITVTPLDDRIVEADETVTLSLDAPAGSLYVVGANATATGTIADNDVANAPNVITLAATDKDAAEPGTNKGSVTVSRSGSIGSALTVFYNAKGTATNGKDYKKLSGAVVIPAGKVSAVIPVNPLNDSIKEKTESVIITLRVSAGYSATSKAAVVAIKDKG